uniref:DJ-1/PfpI family protein n=1 Tax=Oscillatoriales cyanobacterium SpSt-402 TaxID=2282168 RepID=A0A832H5W2_9CYAN
MKVAFVVYTPMTTLDFVGVYDPITRLQTMGFIPELTWEICAIADSVCDSHGLGIVPTQINQPLDSFDVLIIPGGVTPLVYELTKDLQLIEWLQTATNCPLKVSVCTGSLLLGAAGFLTGKKATTHPNAYHLLEAFCDVVTDQRVVDAGDVITARGVTASIDLGLYLCKKFAGMDATQKIRAMMDYPYEDVRSITS